MNLKTKNIKLIEIDYSKKENQIGCGYCANEKKCTEKDPKINKAKLGCKKFIHFEN